eukprot:CAMPEP_0183351066 /NCGR_PEP_ID=MMETSP0164_2-20130417/23339_1 /TAXON_ID=221442 /ORGANISM="Coccolithus pelagicus ssp braarudi, Strain PLY182g" /LENGTH=152 /DNA_ID=CAMNT_0025523157 /DNA_START=30 /DNA_END=488 /DNA_ORIENTATION=+
MAEQKEFRRGTTVKDVPAEAFIAALAEHFRKKNKIEVPEWADLVKTATYKELAPYDENWFFVRAASIARKIYLRGGTGTGALAKVYGGRTKKGVYKSHFSKGAKGMIRNILKQLETADIVAQKGDSGGRWITKNGQRELDVIAGTVSVAKII